MSIWGLHIYIRRRKNSSILSILRPELTRAKVSRTWKENQRDLYRFMQVCRVFLDS